MEPATQFSTKKTKADCPYCAGEGVVRANADDVAFEFDCVCAGGNDEAVRWLLGMQPLPED